MKMSTSLQVLVFWVFTLVPGLASAQELSKEADAIAFVQRAQTYLKEHGLEKAALEFNNLDSAFNTKSPINPHGDLYVIAMNSQGFQSIHGKNPKLRGKPLLDMRDPDGGYPVREMVRVCLAPAGRGWASYKWFNPVTKETEPKHSYVEKVPGLDLCLATGIYR
jgi:signal transduction histidine kinase